MTQQQQMHEVYLHDLACTYAALIEAHDMEPDDTDISDELDAIDAELEEALA